jgi:hypothetical protein
MKLRRVLVERPTLAAAMRQRIRATDATRMPPYGGLSATDVTAFDAFLEALTSHSD